MSELNSFMTMLQLTLEMHPLEDPNEIVRAMAGRMRKLGLFKGTDCGKYVINCIYHMNAYEVMRPAIEIHNEWRATNVIAAEL